MDPSPTRRSHDELLRSINTIQKTNKDIIKALKSRMAANEQIVVEKRMDVEFNQTTQRLEPTWKDIKQPLSNVVREYRVPLRLHDIKPTFDETKDKLNLTYSGDWLADAERLNNRMAPIADKYRMFEGTGPSMEVLRQFEDNYARLQDALGVLHARTIHPDHGNKQRECEAKIRLMQETMEQLRESFDPCSFQLSLQLSGSVRSVSDPFRCVLLVGGDEQLLPNFAISQRAGYNAESQEVHNVQSCRIKKVAFDEVLTHANGQHVSGVVYIVENEQRAKGELKALREAPQLSLTRFGVVVDLGQNRNESEDEGARWRQQLSLPANTNFTRRLPAPRDSSDGSRVVLMSRKQLNEGYLSGFVGGLSQYEESLWRRRTRKGDQMPVHWLMVG